LEAWKERLYAGYVSTGQASAAPGTAGTATSMNQLLCATGFTDIRCQEDRPHVHGITSAVRHVLWRALTAPARLLLAAETGTLRHLLSQNILVVARRGSAPTEAGEVDDFRVAGA
jgi:hypothetical protein